MFIAGLYLVFFPEKAAVTIADSPVPLAGNDREALDERGLVSALGKMEAGDYFLDNMMTIEEAKRFKYEFYAKHPEITLCYSPRLQLLGYDANSEYITGLRVEFLSESGGQSRYEELLSETETFIRSIGGESGKEKIRETKKWIKERCSYTKNPRNMWNECLYGCLVKGEATCLGYSEGFLYMMHRLGVPCRIEFSEYHAWNEVYDGENWIKVDLTK